MILRVEHGDYGDGADAIEACPLTLNEGLLDCFPVFGVGGK